MLNSEKAMFALNDTKNEHLDSARARLGYSVGKASRRLKTKKIITFALAAALMLALGSAAYATGWFGLSSRLVSAESPYEETAQAAEATPTAAPNPISGGWMAQNGDADSPEAQASLAWEKARWQFMQEIQSGEEADHWLAENGDMHPEARIYDCFSQEMLDTLQETAEQYGLKLHTETAHPSTQKLFEKATGVGNFLLTEDATWQRHYLFEDGSFKGEGEILQDGKTYTYSLNRSMPGVLAPYGLYVKDPENYEEWQAVIGGHTLNLALRKTERGFGGFVLLRENNLFLTIQLSSEETAATAGKKVLEELAACFDYDVLCEGKPDLAAINNLTAVKAKPKEGLLTIADFAKTPEYRAAAAFHDAYNRYVDQNPPYEGYVTGQDWRYIYAPFPTGIEEMDTLLDELQKSYHMILPSDAKAYSFERWVRPEYMTYLMSYSLPEGESSGALELGKATEEDAWKLMGVENFLLDDQSYVAVTVSWDNGAWQSMIVYGSNSYELSYIPKGSFCPSLRGLLHPEAEGWAYDTACGEQISMTTDGSIEYPRLPAPTAVYETENAYVVLGFMDANEATMQLCADNIDFTKFP